MKLSSLPQAYRNATRWREILTVLSRHGLADWLARLDTPLAKRLTGRKPDDASARLSREQRVRLACEELGPAFIKIGQALATRPDLVGVELAEELAKLQTAAPADPPETSRATIEADLGRPIDECFAWFEDQPVASGSIGQVHRARRHDGREVAVKVRHPNVAGQIAADGEVLLGLAELAEKAPDLAKHRPAATARELLRSLRREIDLDDERRRIERFREAFDGDDRVRIPEPHADLSAGRVLTLEWLDGAKVSDPRLPETTDIDLSQVAQHGAEVFLEMIFDHGVYHADPHPGNLLVMPDGALGLLDFGMTGRVSDSLREDLEDVLLAIAANDTPELTAALLRIGTPPSGLDSNAFSADVADFVDRFGRQSVDRIRLGEAVTELFRLVRRHDIALSPQLAMLLKLLVMLEGAGERLSPEFALVDLIAPMQRRMILRRLDPRRQGRKARRLVGELEQLAEMAPRQLRDVLEQVQSGRFEVHLDHRGLEPSVNRLVLGLVTSALIVAGSLMVSREVMPVSGVSAPGAVAMGLATLLGARLGWAIRKSGWLDSR